MGGRRGVPRYAIELLTLSLPKTLALTQHTTAHRRAFHDAQADPDVLPQDLLRKYLTYAKQHCRPQLQQADYDKIERVRASCARGRSCGDPSTGTSRMCQLPACTGPALAPAPPQKTK